MVDRPGHSARLAPLSALQRNDLPAATIKYFQSQPDYYLALTGPKGIWWFNGFDSPEEQNQVAEAYKTNAAFAAALKKNSDRKAQFIGKVSELAARYRPDLGSGAPWILGQGRFLVIAVTKERPSGRGTVFQADDGTFFVLSSARTRNASSSRSVRAVPMILRSSGSSPSASRP